MSRRAGGRDVPLGGESGQPPKWFDLGEAWDSAFPVLREARSSLQAQGDPSEAGRQLGVHENTIRYRLRKMTELTPLDLQDGNKRLAMMIEVVALDSPSAG